MTTTARYVEKAADIEIKFGKAEWAFYVSLSFDATQYRCCELRDRNRVRIGG